MSVDETFSLSGKVAIVTGGSRGIGKAIAVLFAKAGARVVVVSRKREACVAAADEIRAQGGEVLALGCHCGKESEIEAMVAKVRAEMGRIDILVNNAGTNPHFGPMLTASETLWDKTFEVNLKGYFWAIRACVPAMDEVGGGSIINLTSVAGIRPGFMMGVYSMTKAGVISLTRSLARELGPQKIRVNCIAPGVIKTSLSQAIWSNEEMMNSWLAMQPLPRLGEPDEVAGAALYLASKASSYATGEVMVVDGGQTI